MSCKISAWWIIDQLVQQGIELFCIGPGSRNTPLILAAAEHPKAKTIVHFDERGLGFYALGYGKGAKKGAAVIVTSGTAVANLLPSIMEAHHSLTPLLLVTADRPLELKECGANQTTDQVKIFSSFLRWEIDISSDLTETHTRSIVAQGVSHTLGNRPGPVQINCSFQEPFTLCFKEMKEGSNISHVYPTSITAPQHITAQRGAILIGALDGPIEPILELAQKIKWPIFADILSNARATPTFEQVRYFDLILKTNTMDSPDFVLHFGQRLTSKEILKWPVTMHVAKSDQLQDPNRTLKIRIQSDIEPFCKSFEARSNPDWLQQWKQQEELMKKLLHQRWSLLKQMTESGLMCELIHFIDTEVALFLGNGMPIREADLFLFPQTRCQFFANRGLSGIDGNIATIAGLTEALQKPVIAIIGDQTALHDLNSLALIKKTPYPVTLIIFNNFGGGIFSHLPVAHSPYFETHIANQHNRSFQKGAEMFDIPYFQSLETARWDVSSVIELIFCRKANWEFHQMENEQKSS